MSTGAPDHERSAHFATTQWSIVLAAGQGNSSDARRALSSLCSVYWHPLYAYARRRAGDVHEAQDLTQAFFTHLLEKNLVAIADPQRGRFRSFLLTSFKNFVANERDKARSKKRGGGQAPIPLDFALAESRHPLATLSDISADRAFDQQWALSLLDQVLNRLREEYVTAGKAAQFDALKEHMAGSPAPHSYAEAAGRLGITENAARVAAHRLKRRYRELLREEIARTVAEPAEVDDEIRSLFAILGR